MLRSAALLVFAAPLSASQTHIDEVCDQGLDTCNLGLLQVQAQKRSDQSLDDVCAEDAWSLRNAQVTHSNLGNAGPDSGAPNLVFGNVQPGIDLVVTATSDYIPNSLNPDGGILNNKVQNGFGTINLATGSAVTLNFAFKRTGIEAPVSMPRFAFTVFDTDQGMAHESREQVTISGFASYKISQDSDLTVTPSAAGTTFSSTLRGGKVDNPVSPTSLSTLQERRSFVVVFDAGTTDFAVTVSELNFARPQGRNFMFAGASGLSCSEDAPCTDMICPAGFSKRADAEFLECASAPCTAADTATCCYEL